MSRSGWDAIGNEFTNDSPSPFEKWWKAIPGTATEKMLQYDRHLADLIFNGQITMDAAKRVLYLRDVDALNRRCLERIAKNRPPSYVLTFNARGYKHLALKCQCGAIRCRVAWWWHDSVALYTVSCSTCGLEYWIDLDGRKIWRTDPDASPIVQATPVQDYGVSEFVLDSADRWLSSAIQRRADAKVRIARRKLRNDLS